MHGKSVSPLVRVVKPQFSVWYQMFSSQMAGVSTVEMKSQTELVTSTMYRFAPILSNLVISKVGILLAACSRPQPLGVILTTPPCSLPHFKRGISQLGQS